MKKAESSARTTVFFCESCGARVPANAVVCPRCGGRFESVRCPACDFVGEENLFRSGCPVCGYSAGKRGPSGKTAAGKASAPSSLYAVSSLPAWVYAAVVFALVLVLGILFLVIK